MLHEVYKKYYSRAKSLKFRWTTKMLVDVTDELEQDQIIQTYHDTNHRGVTESTKHLQRKYFSPK